MRKIIYPVLVLFSFILKAQSIDEQITGTLRPLEADELVERTVYPEVPIHVEYVLTVVGHSLLPIIVQLTDWS